MTIHFTIPSLYCPLPVPGDHPDLALLERRGLDWVASSGIAPTPRARRLVANSHAHVLMSLMAPWTPAERMQIAVDWCYFMFAFDDLRTDAGPASTSTARLMRWLNDLNHSMVVPDGPRPGADPFHPAIAELSARVRAATSPESWRRWVDLHLPVAWAALWESTQRALDLAPAFDAYLLPRIGLGASQPLLATLEIVAELHVPEREREHPLVRTATEVACLLVCLDDDLYSHPKENWLAERAGRDPAAEPAGIPILMREHHLGVDEAVLLLVDIRDRLVLLLTRLLALIRKGPFSHDTIQLVDIAASTVPACLAWARNCSRYTDPDGQSPGLIHLRWAGPHDVPPSNHDPLPYPSIASWWQLPELRS